MRCPSCDHLNEANANFCSRCGSPMGPAGVVEAEATATLAPIEVETSEEAHIKELAPGQSCLVVRRGPAAGTKYTLEKDVVTVGRHPQSDIFLNDITVSRRHAEVRKARDGGSEDYLVADLGSLNGTYVNRTRVDSSPLANGDELQIGKFRLLFLVKE